MSGIHYVSYKNIDKVKWDRCISNAVNSLIYARSSYLDAMAPRWDGLILGDYEAVMPLTFKKKFGIKYLYQPAFLQQAGVFFTGTLSKNDLQSFIEAATAEFSLVEIFLNYENHLLQEGKNFTIRSCNNFLLSMHGSYDMLHENYLPAFTKSLRRLKKLELKYRGSSEPEKHIAVYTALYRKRLPHISAQDITRFTLLCKKLKEENNLLIRYAEDGAGEMLASVILLRDEKRLYNIISTITPAGKRVEANYFLYDRVIHEFAGSGLVMDFEGSDIPGIKSFYQKFNPVNQPYFFLKANNLPAVVKLFKK